MMKKRCKIAILLLCLMFVASFALAACGGLAVPPGGNGGDDGSNNGNGSSSGGSNGNGSGGNGSTATVPYTIYVYNLAGIGLNGVRVTVDLGTSPVSRTTDIFGKCTPFSAKPGEYSVTVEDLPDGYSVGEVKTSATEYTLKIYATSSVIKGQIPADKVYKEGDVIYDFSITDDTNGQNYTLSEVLKEKKMVLLNFWNTKCVPCMAELPWLELAYKQYSDDVEVFAISVPFSGNNDRKTQLIQTRSDDSLTYPLALDNNDMTSHFGLTEIPVSVVIDRYGVIALIHVGSMNEAGFAALFEKYTADNYANYDGLGL